MKTTAKYQYREAWLHAAIEAMKPAFHGTDYPLPDKVRAACAFPSKRATGLKAKTVGQCWAPQASADGAIEVMISPVVAEPMMVSSILAHELTHAAVGNECGHKGPFRTVATKLGLEGPMRSTVAGEAFKQMMTPILAALGPYPHATLDASTAPKQSTRLLKAECHGEGMEGGPCGYTVRVTKKWVVTLGAPHCPIHGEMACDVPEDGAGDQGDEGEG
jgi:hypothetical protein